MREHDPICPRFGHGYITGTTCGYCDLIIKAREEERTEERAQREAVARLLLDSGDITPMGARILTMPRKSDE